jgi:threonine dehydratase
MTSARPKWPNIEYALQFLQRFFPPTRCVAATSLSKRTHGQVHFKLESEMPTGSFKVRGAMYALHAEMTRRQVTEVVASSTGNHGAAVAYAAKLLNVPAKIFLPVKSNLNKQSRIRACGAEIVEHGKDISEAFEAAQQYAGQCGAFLLNDATNTDVPAGTATIAVEILQQLPNVAAIWVPIGDTALIRGVASAAKHLRPGVRIVGVQAERAPAYYLSCKQGIAVSTDACDTIADGLATRIPVEENVIAIRELVDDVRLVTEEQMLGAIAHLRVKECIVSEPAGAATTAAWLADSASASSGQNVLIVTGSNIAEAVLQLALTRADATSDKTASISAPMEAE